MPLHEPPPKSSHSRSGDGPDDPFPVIRPTFLLTCCKTGRFWRFASEGQARNAARHFGVADFTMEQVIA